MDYYKIFKEVVQGKKGKVQKVFRCSIIIFGKKLKEAGNSCKINKNIRKIK